MFIIRNPFITQKRRAAAYIYADLAEAAATESQLYLERENPDYEEAVEWLKLAALNLNMAANALGFRNATDMERWRQKHGRLP